MHQDVTAVIQQILDGHVASSLESSALDFKEESRKVSETERTVRDAAICFANADGGTIVLGIKEKTRMRDQRGSTEGTESKPEVKQRPSNSSAGTEDNRSRAARISANARSSVRRSVRRMTILASG